MLSSYTSGNYRHTTYINVPCNVSQIFSVRGGLQNYHDISDLSYLPGDKDNKMVYKDANGVLKDVIDNTNLRH